VNQVPLHTWFQQLDCVKLAILELKPTSLGVFAAMPDHLHGTELRSMVKRYFDALLPITILGDTE